MKSIPHLELLIPWSTTKFREEPCKEGKVEVKLAKMATTMGSTDAVKELGTMLMTDHKKVNMELMAIAEAKGIEIPEPDEKDMKKVEEISQMEGTKFDTAFLKAMTTCHNKDIALFEKAQKNVKDEELKAFIDKTLPVLKAHAKKIEMCSNKEKHNDKGEKNGN